MSYKKPKVAFICVHNSCRSQIAEFLAHIYASDIFDSYSAGTEIKTEINQDGVRNIKELYHFDIRKEYHSKLISDIPQPDIVIKMGCEVSCPFLKSNHEEDWGIEDPTGTSDKNFIKIIKIIEEKVINLKERIQNDEIQWLGE